MLDVRFGIPTISCLPARVAARTPHRLPGLDKTACVTPASYCSPQALPYLASGTACGTGSCPTNANAHQSASYTPPEKRHASALPKTNDSSSVLFMHASGTHHVPMCNSTFFCRRDEPETRCQQSRGAVQTRSATSVPHCSSSQGFRFTLQHPPNCIPELSEINAYFLRQAS